MATDVEVELLGTVWEEGARLGHTVEIVAWEDAPYWPHRRRVLIKHMGVHNKRAQRNNTIIEFRLFQQRYRRIDI